MNSFDEDYSLEQVDRIANETSKRSHGLQVFNRLEEVRKEGGEKHQSRWFWELLQNAKDAVKSHETVEVHAEINDDHVRFSHTGNPFSLEEIIQLIVQGSTKTDLEDKTGRFGTGFISTYVLSEKVRIQGPLEKNAKFDFTLDREAQDENEFLAKQEKSKRDFSDSTAKVDISALTDIKTTFTYPLTEDKKDIAYSGLEQIETYLPFVLAFNKKLREIKITINGRTDLYSKRLIQGPKNPNNSVQQIEIIHKTKEKYKNHYLVGCIKRENWDAAILLKKIGSKYNIVHLDDSYPKFFYAFPLLDTGSYGFPLVINSEQLSLKTERNDVYLTTNRSNDSEIAYNKRVVENALGSIQDFIKWARKKDIKSMIHLYDLKEFEKDGLDKGWLDRQKVKTINSIKHLTSFPTEGDDKNSLIDFSVPVEADKNARGDLYDLQTSLQSTLPRKQELDYWHNLISNHASLLQADIYSLEYVSSIHLLAKEVQKLGTKKGLENLLADTDTEIYEWLNDFYSLIQRFAPKLFNEKAVLLNQNDKFVKRNSDLKKDEINDKELLQVDILLGNNIKSNLIHQHISLPPQVCNPIKREEYVDTLLAKINNKAEEEYDEEAIKANALMLKWLTNKAQIERIKSFQVITTTRGETPNKEGFSTTKKHKLLAPQETWKDEFPVYSEMIHPEVCLHDIYSEFLKEKELNKLEEEKFIHTKPLVKRKEKVHRNSLRKLMTYPSEISKLEDEEGEIGIGEVEYRDFAYLVATENSILAKQSFVASKRILKFILKEAPNVDEGFKEVRTMETESGKIVELQKSIWPGRLRDSQWVYVKTTSGDEEKTTYSSETPSSKNIAELVREDEELKDLIEEDKAASILGKLGVSLAEVTRSMMDNEEEKVEWDRAFISLMNMNISPSEANSIIKDPETIKNYRERTEKKKQLKSNQRTGTLFEKVFEKHIRKYAPDLSISREPWGSDYIIEHDIIHDDVEEVFKIGNHFVELKATKSKHAAMSSEQVKTAVEKKDHYSLVVLELNGRTIDEDKVIKDSFVVSDIGYRLEDQFNALQQVKGDEIKLQEQQGDIQIIMDPGDTKFHIKQELWGEGKSLKTFIYSLLNSDTFIKSQEHISTIAAEE